MPTPSHLLDRAEALLTALVADQSLHATSHITEHFRDPSTAHRYSTAYHIVAGMISRPRLMQHPIDMDGNVWFRREWLIFARLEPDADAYLDAVVKSQAASLAQATWGTEWHHFVGRTLTLRWPRLDYALEGYAAESPQRLPNLEEVPLSKHVSGLAIDLALHLNALTDVWDAHIDATAHAHGLYRPYTLAHHSPEAWHFELLDSAEPFE